MASALLVAVWLPGVRTATARYAFVQSIPAIAQPGTGNVVRSGDAARDGGVAGGLSSRRACNPMIVATSPSTSAAATSGAIQRCRDGRSVGVHPLPCVTVLAYAAKVARSSCSTSSSERVWVIDGGGATRAR